MVVIGLGNLTHIDKGCLHLNIICSELGLKLMQRHENCIEFLLLEGLVSTSSETSNDRLFTCYKSAKHITIVTQYIGNPEDSKCHMPHNLSHRYSSGAHAHHLRFRAIVDFRSTSQMTTSGPMLKETINGCIAFSAAWRTVCKGLVAKYMASGQCRQAEIFICRVV